MTCTLTVTVEAPPSYQRCLSSAAATTTDSSTCEELSGPLSCAVRVLTAVERSLLRALAFVLHRLHRDHARFCARSVLQWYLLLQSQLPEFAVESLKRATASVSSLADASFSDFWLSLLRSEVDRELKPEASSSSPFHKSAGPLEVEPQAQTTDSDKKQQQQQHLLARLYEYITCSIMGFFADRSSSSDATTRRNLTPCTSPVSSATAPSLRQRQKRLASTDSSGDEGSYWSCRNWGEDDDATVASTDEESDWLEPGWAVEYMQQEVALPTAMKRRMAAMMHSTVPLNLFRATVAYPSTDNDDTRGEEEEEEDDDRSSCCASDRGRGFVGAITPGSLPPTPVTRDLQARRMHRYTVFVLDHTTHALQLLETHCFE